MNPNQDSNILKFLKDNSENIKEEKNINLEIDLRLEDLEVKKVETLLRKEELEGQKQDRIERKTFANKIFVFLSIFMSISLVILILVGLDFICFWLSDTVIIALLTTASANVIGIFLFVVRYLFKANQSCPHCGKSIVFKYKEK